MNPFLACCGGAIIVIGIAMIAKQEVIVSGFLVNDFLTGDYAAFVGGSAILGGLILVVTSSLPEKSAAFFFLSPLL